MVLGWIIFSLIVGFIGSGRKIGFGLAFLASLILSPVIGLIITLVSKNKSDEAYKNKVLDTQEEQRKALVKISERRVEKSEKVPVDNNTISIADELLKLKTLLDQDIITKKEFDDLKLGLMNNSQQKDTEVFGKYTQSNLDVLRKKLKKGELIVEIKETKEYKIITKTEYETAKELDLAKYYSVKDEYQETLEIAENLYSKHRTESLQRDDLDSLKIKNNSNIRTKKSYNKKNTIIVISLIILLPLTAKFVGDKIDDRNKTEEAKSVSVFIGEKDIARTKKVVVASKRYGIDGDGIEVRKGPGKQFGKVLNKKASGILKKDIYVTVDYTAKVEVEEIKGQWSKIRVVIPDYLKDSHRGWILSKYIINKKTSNTAKIKLYSDLDKLRGTLSGNGIGKLSDWKGDELGWYSFTDYYTFGTFSSINAMQNNIAYYINGREKKAANEVKIVLNINNKTETKEALKKLNKLSIKTLKSLGLVIHKGTSDNILNSKPFEFENDIYRLVLELDQSKIETWNLSIYSK